MQTSTAVKVLAALLIVIVAAGAIYAALTYPRVILTIPVSLTVGVDIVNKEFDQSAFSNRVQVQVKVSSGSGLWLARILNGTQVLWEHAASQGEQTNYSSGWIELPSGNYNLTFGTVGFGSLDAQITVSSIGGFW